MSADLFGVTAGPPRRALGSHESASGGSDEWLTPPHVIEALGDFDLDPCSPGERRPWDTATKHYGIEDDGLAQKWEGRVWLNPPYASTALWLNRLAEHDHGTALIFARVETALWFTHVWPKATALLFLRGRLNFHYIDGRRAKANSGAASVLVAYGQAAAHRLWAACGADLEGPVHPAQAVCRDASMTARIVNLVTTEHVTIESTGTQQGGLPVVLVDGVLMTVREVETVAQLVAQTFDPPAKSARIAGTTQDVKRPQQSVFAHRPGPDHDDLTEQERHD